MSPFFSIATSAWREAIIGLSIYSLAGAAFAQAGTQCPPPLPAPTNEQWVEKSKSPKSAGFLWQMEKDGRISWLYGTIHVNSVEFAMPGATVLNAIKGVDTVVLELDVSTPNKLKQLEAEIVKPTANTTPLKAATVERIKAYANTLCLPAENFLKLPPTILPVALPIQALRHKGIYPEFMMDAFIGGLATGLKKQVVALETVQAQVNAVIDPSVSADTQLEETLDKLATGESQKLMEKIFTTWSRNDLAEFERFFEWCDCVKTPKEQTQMKRLNDDRNQHMAKQIAAILQQSKRLFVAVGSLHMIGEQGLPTLLRQQGFNVTPVKLTP